MQRAHAAGLAFERATGLPDSYICEQPGVRPFIMNWQAYPRLYPPGALVIGVTRQAQFWHPMFLLPLLAIARPARWPARLAIIAWIVGVAIIDGTPAMAWRFLHDVVTLNV